MVPVRSRGRGGMWRGRSSVVLQFVGREITLVEFPLGGRDVSVGIHRGRRGGRSIGRWSGSGLRLGSRLGL